MKGLVFMGHPCPRKQLGTRSCALHMGNPPVEYTPNRTHTHPHTQLGSQTWTCTSSGS